MLPGWKTMVDALDRAFSRAVILRDQHFYERCPFCSVRPIQGVFHFLTRAKFSVRWDRRNAVGSCSFCNGRYENDALFVSYVETWYIDRFGQEQWDALKADGNRIADYTQEQLDDMLAALKHEASAHV